MTSIVLVHPEIPGNTGAVGRTCVALDIELVLIHPLGFTITDTRLKRAGLDYWQHIRLAEFASWDAFLAQRTPRDDQLYLFEEYAQRSFYEPAYPDDAYLVFGCETKGLPEQIVAAHRAQMVNLPMRSDKVRSLNLANTVTAAAYQAVRAQFTG
ncbi:MAG: tRNA (uridine(34)/cytosine(34)/5-carboxymethylaminomethyluridine(34)-2'-O)-methyltransferase TrmL [Sphingomonadales bacterium 32-64-22]|nr:MAG: tRNA (uridine(34)/cytosine(34)/5-carboxymethylaminomethyluridine(34)-2'-O)-methyltransferase TrmL [Sphingomonadales bacterium 32-64-22]